MKLAPGKEDFFIGQGKEMDGQGEEIGAMYESCLAQTTRQEYKI